jgi:NADH:ubiquinone oxidoreductase subunit 3 (subunit A)
MIFEYLNLYILVILSLIISVVILTLSYLTIYQKLDSEKISAYECGFYPFEDARNKFDVRFYLVAILFIIFDLEVMYLVPWSVVLNLIGLLGFWSMMVFLIILIIGFVYEWQKGALKWS